MVTVTRIDLHTHSTASDGTLAPADLVRAAADAGLDVVALTDHDTTRGWDEAAAALPTGLSLVRGAELSCRAYGIGVHLLAYLFDPVEEAFATERRLVRESRLRRGERMVEMLRGDGYDVSWPGVLADAGGGTIGRPHIARSLVRHGYVSTVDEAFTPRWLGSRGAYWVPKRETDAEVAVALVRGAGGVPVLAHPRSAKRGRTVSDEMIEHLAAAGLAGLEVEHVDHRRDERRQLRVLADRLGLLTTGSSDFHGTNKTTPLGAETTAPAAYAALVAQATGCPVLRT